MRHLFILLTALAGFASAPLGKADTRPNIVFMIADDLAWDDLGCSGNPKVRTPHLDRLTKGGMQFPNAFLTISSCSPSRASIITGTYPHQTDAEQLHWPLPADRLTFVELLKASGYWTAAAGKWHLGNAVKDRFDEVREADVSGFQLPTGEAAKAGKVSAKRLDALAAETSLPDAAWAAHLLDSAGAGAAAGAGGSGVQAARALKK